LRRKGFSENEVKRIAGLNWLEFFEKSFAPQNNSKSENA